MLSNDELVTKIAEAFTDHIPGLSDASEEVQDVYRLAQDQFGKDNVDLQKCNNWNWIALLNSDTSLHNFLDIFNVDTSMFDRLNESWRNELREPDSLKKFLDNIPDNSAWRNSRIACYAIIVHFHNITVSNEEGRSTLIEDIYAEVPLLYDGKLKGGIKWCRTTVSNMHYRCNYRHSHLQPMHPDGRAYWQVPCLGTGPIITTMETLRDECNKDIWMLFWLELDNCIRVESLAGGPYFRIENLTDERLVGCVHSEFTGRMIAGHFSYIEMNSVLRGLILSGKLKFAYDVNKIIIANTFSEFYLLCSDIFFEIAKATKGGGYTRYVTDLFGRRHIFLGQIRPEGRIYEMRSNEVAEEGFSNPAGFEFKDEEVMFTVLPAERRSDFTIYLLLEYDTVCWIHSQLTMLVNNVYARKLGAA